MHDWRVEPPEDEASKTEVRQPGSRSLDNVCNYERVQQKSTSRPKSGKHMPRFANLLI